MPEAGFGRPVNALSTDKIHWWNEDGTQICGTDPNAGFVGGKMRPSAVDIVSVCPKCYNMVQPLMSTVLKARS